MRPDRRFHYARSPRFLDSHHTASNGHIKSRGRLNAKARHLQISQQYQTNHNNVDDTLDTDDPEHISWLYTKALARAQEFSIPGVTYSLTQGVVKNIIPAIASTNAIVAASCCNEAFKILTAAAPSLGTPGSPNYSMYTGDDSVYTYTFEHQRKEDCPVCGPALAIDAPYTWTLQQLVDSLGAVDREQRFENPSLSTGERSLYYATPESLAQATRPNLKRKLKELLADGEEFAVSDPAYQTQFRFKLTYRDRVDA